MHAPIWEYQPVAAELGIIWCVTKVTTNSPVLNLRQALLKDATGFVFRGRAAALYWRHGHTHVVRSTISFTALTATIAETVSTTQTPLKRQASGKCRSTLCR
jgi:hypothetical protein